MPALVSSLILATDALRPHQARPDGGVPVEVWDVLSVITDPRGRRGRRYELATVLVVAFAAVIGGARSLAAIADWAGDVPCWQWPRLGITRRPPSLSTIRRVLLRVDAEVVDAVLHAWLARAHPITGGVAGGCGRWEDLSWCPRCGRITGASVLDRRPHDGGTVGAGQCWWERP